MMTAMHADGRTVRLRRRLTRHPALVLVIAAAGTVWGAKLVDLSRSVAEHRSYWAQPRGTCGGLVYVALGDSAAQGIGASDPEHGYVALLADRLRTSTGQPVRLINLSRSGARLADVLDTQLPALAALAPQPDLITIDIGGNDVRAYDATRFAAEAATVTAALPSGTFIADVPYFMHGRWERHAAEAARVLTREAERHDLNVVPLHEAQRRGGWQAMFTQFAADWFHPNDRGHRAWADAFWTSVRTTPLALPRAPA